MKKILSDFKIDRITHEINSKRYSFSESMNAISEIKKLRARLAWLENEVYATQIEYYVRTVTVLFKFPLMGISLIIELLKKSDKNGEIHLTTESKREILERTSLEEKTYNNVIGKLQKANLISRIKRHSYKTNSNIFGKRGWSDLRNRKKLWIKVSFDHETGLPEVTTCFTKSRAK